MVFSSFPAEIPPGGVVGRYAEVLFSPAVHTSSSVTAPLTSASASAVSASCRQPARRAADGAGQKVPTWRDRVPE
jgi:hypothetical protein